MHTKAVLLAALTATVVAGGAVAAHATDGGTHGSSRSGAQTLSVVEHAVTDTTADTGPKGDSLGDVLAFANPIFDKADKKQVGSDNGTCVRTAVGRAYDCQWSVGLKGGQIMVQGPFYDAKDSRLAITGGTGAYAGASGWMLLHARDAKGSAYDFTYHLSR
jgi:hypothetical protein